MARMARRVLLRGHQRLLSAPSSSSTLPTSRVFSSTSTSTTSSPWWVPQGWRKDDCVRDGDKYNRWMALPPAVAAEMSVGAVYCWSMWTGPLTHAVGVVAAAPADWSLAAVTPAFSCCALTLGITTTLLGKWVEAVGPRVAGSVGALAWGGGLAVAGLGVEWHSLPLVYLGYSGLGGVGWGLLYLTPVSAMMKWFPDRRGLATGITLSAFGLGATVGPLLIGGGLEHFFVAPELLGSQQLIDVVTQSDGTQVVDYAALTAASSGDSAGDGGDFREVVVATAADASRRGVESGAGVYLAGSGDSGAAGAFAALGAAYGAAGLAASRLICLPQEGWEPAAPAASSQKKEEEGNEGEIEGAVAMKQQQQQQDGGAGAGAAPGAKRTLSAGEGVTAEVATGTVQFPLLWMTVFGYATGGLALISSAKLLVTDIFGGVCPDVVTPAFATAYLSYIGLANSSGRFGWAAASDALGRRATYALFGAAVPVMAGAPFLAHYAAATSTTTAATAATASAVASTVAPLYLFCGGSLLAITFYGGTFSVLPAYIADLWGQKHSAAIHGKALTAWSAASVTGPVGLTQLRGYEERKAIDGLLDGADPEAFERTFGTPLRGGEAGGVEALIEAKTVTIARLMEIAPPGTTDPTPFLYDSTCFAAAALLGTAAVSHAFIKPLDVSALLEKEAAKAKEAAAAASAAEQQGEGR